MPKIIKDADGAVRRCAAELFEKLGYRKVDIKMISAGSGVAVGTVYNYYKNKLELYLSVTEESWQKTFDRLEREAARQSGEKDRLSAISAILYEDMRDRRGLGRALVFPDGEERGEQERLRQLHVKLAGSAGRIIGDICRSGQPGAAGQNRPDDTVRLAETPACFRRRIDRLPSRRRQQKYRFPDEYRGCGERRRMTIIPELIKRRRLS